MQLQDYDITTRYRARVLASERITSVDFSEEVRDISLEIASSKFHILAGQNIGVLAPGQTEIGQQHHFRLYSIADLPQTTAQGHQEISICVRRCSYIDEFSGDSR